jgi:hypothetical protein
VKVIDTRNVHQVLPYALQTLFAEGVKRDSRNGPVLQFPTPVTTVYHRPMEKVLFWPVRDANPFFHLYESLWMLAGRNDVAGVARYAGNMRNYSDDTKVLHGAYGHRWRKHFGEVTLTAGKFYAKDQLALIAKMLQADGTDRRAVLQMWDVNSDLYRQGKDVPCNTIATFQVSPAGELDLHVFCRSNDIVWGAYGANAVHFAFLLEYMAYWTQWPVGKLYQISINWHGYLEVLKKHESLVQVREGDTDPYRTGDVRALELVYGNFPIEELDRRIEEVLMHADTGFALPYASNDDEPFFDMAYHVLRAHHFYKTQSPHHALNELMLADQRVDWVVAAREWLTRRIK